MAEPVRILDHRVRQLRCQMVDQVKVQWDSYSPDLVTWEDTYDMRQQFPFLFDRYTYDTVVFMILWYIYFGIYTKKLRDEV